MGLSSHQEDQGDLPSLSPFWSALFINETKKRMELYFRKLLDHKLHSGLKVRMGNLPRLPLLLLLIVTAPVKKRKKENWIRGKKINPLVRITRRKRKSGFIWCLRYALHRCYWILPTSVPASPRHGGQYWFCLGFVPLLRSLCLLWCCYSGTAGTKVNADKHWHTWKKRLLPLSQRRPLCLQSPAFCNIKA